VSFGKQSEWVCSGCKGTNWKADWDYDKWCADCRLGDDLCLSDKDAKLVQYLAKHKHYSPFGHCFASFHIKAPIFVARQLVKHEYLRMNEISRRYVDSEPEFYVPDVWRGRAKDKKQGSADWSVPYATLPLVVETGSNIYEGSEWTEYNKIVIDLYKELLSANIAPEMARMVLPQSMYTEWYWSGSMDAFANMCALRLKEDTQYETRLVAQQIDKLMQALYPVSWKALVQNE
jgi:thymidylate synthase (FAD)